MAYNVLVVDDSAVMRKMIIRTLELTGLPLGQVYEAANGEEGLAVLDRHWIDVALVDINMPILDGEQMIRRVREQPATQDLPIVIVSTDRSEERADRLREKVAGFVHKPFTPEQLRDVVSGVLGGAS
jgi:two-component system chemotaxis response regulator CheY